MARLKGVATCAETALVAATVKTLLQLTAPTNQQIVITGFSICFDGTSGSAEPVQVEVLRQTTAGTGSTNTPVLLDGGSSGTLQATAKDTYTVEPTAGNILAALEVHPQSGYEKVFAPYSPQEIVVPGGGRVSIRATAPAGVNCRVTIAYEE